jgi:putative transposase
MKPRKGSNFLRKGRASIKNQHYLITTAVVDRKPVLNQAGAAKIVLESLHWLEDQGKILLDAAVVMPDHLHFVAGLKQGSLSQSMHSLKSYTAQKINFLLQKEGPFWQRHYHDHALRQDEDLIEVVRYALNNPVRAGLVKDFHDYPFWHCRWDM